MKISVDDKELFKIEEWEKKVLEHYLPLETLHEECCRRLKWVIKHKIERCYEELEKKWIKKLREDPKITSIPVDKKSFVELVLKNPDYKNRSERMKTEKSGEK